MNRIVVVGGGIAGASTVAALRQAGYAGYLTLVAGERHRPYDRPPLSKGLLLGAVEDTTLETSYDGVELLLGRCATGLRPGVLETDGGDLDWDGLVLATGAAPVSLGGGKVLRTIDDALAIRAAMRPGARIVVVGAGWIGAEVATAALLLDCVVTVVEAAQAPLAAALGSQIGALTVPWYAGIDLRLSTPVATVHDDGVELVDGARLTADCVVVGIGVRPQTDWLIGSPVELDRGVVVDERLAASMPGVVAVGDCAAWWSRRFATRLRVEHWDDALQAPTVAVRTLLRGTAVESTTSEPGPVHDPVPYFWSEQFGRMVQYVGHRDGADQLVRRGDPAEPDWAVCWLRAGVLVAMLTVNRQRDLLQGRRAIAAALQPDLEKLADPTVPVRAAVSVAEQ